MNSHQIRVLRSVIRRERNNYYETYRLFQMPFLRKRLDEIVIGGKKINFSKQVVHSYKLWKGDNVYDSYSVEYNHFSQTLFIITKNDIIIYWTSSSIFAPASAAWHILTEVYHGYRKDMAVYEWQSVDDFECAQMSLIELRRKDWYDECMMLYHSEYQLKKFKETGLAFIDRRTITQEEADILAEKEYYHT